MANTVLLESRSYRPFKSSEEYLYAMREDLAEWLNTLYPELRINCDNFMDRLDTGVSLCKHANNVRVAAEEYLARRQARNKCMTKSMTSGLAGPILSMGNIHFLPAAKSGTFFARDNVSNFISWCRKSLLIFECLLFETDDLIMRKNEKHVILCLLEVARRGAKFGMLAPMLVQMERQIDREIAADNRANGQQTDQDSLVSKATESDNLFESDSEDEDQNDEPMLMYGPQPQIITNDLKSLDEMVRDLVEKCTCPSQFPMVRVSEGKYRIGDTKVLIFVRILRSHVMVRVGGGWDTLSHYLDKHDPCRCKAQHRSSVAARLLPRVNQATNGIELHKAQVIYERSPPPVRKVMQNQNTSPIHSAGSYNPASTLSPPSRARSRSRSPAPHGRYEGGAALEHLQIVEKQQPASPNLARRRLIEFKNKKQNSLDSPLSSAVLYKESFSNVIASPPPPPPPLPPLDTIAISLSGNKQNIDVVDGKFENISDNGSEISDEGYRSLGLIQNSNNNNNAIQSKRLSLNSQASTEDADTNARLEQTTSSDSQISPTDTAKTDATLETNSPSDTLDASSSQDDHLKIFEQSGVFITDDDITIDIATTTGLRKTDFSSNLYGDDDKPIIVSKIPRSPIVRRKSIDNSSSETASPLMARKGNIFRSVRKPSATTKVAKEPPKDMNTWSGGRNAIGKKRPVLVADTFAPSTNGNSTFSRNTTTRASQNLYDKNGRRIKSTNTSPTKPPATATTTSPLAQQILEAAGNAKNDAQMLEKMKALLSKYTKTDKNATGDDVKEYDDFTTAWVNSNGILDRATTNCSMSSPTKIHSKRSSAASSIDSTNSKDFPILSPRRDRGMSRIPAPIRQNTELY